MPFNSNDLPSYLNWNYTMPSLGPNGELVGGPDPYADQVDPSRGTDIRNQDGTFTHIDAHKDRNGNYINPTTFMSDSLPGGVAYAFPDTDEYAHIGRVFRTDRNRAIGKMLAIVGGGALASSVGAGAGAGVGDIAEGYGITPGFVGGAEAAGELAPIAVNASYLPAIAGSSIPYIGGSAAAVGSTLGGSMAAFPALAGGAETGTLGGLLGSTGGGEGLPALMGDVGMEAPANSAGFFSKLGTLGKNYFTKADGSYDWMKIAKAGIAATGALGGGGSKQPQAPGRPAWLDQPMTPMTMMRQQTAPMARSDYYKYGHGDSGEHQFFTDNAIPQKAGGGSVSGPGSGRSDDIEARLSDGEYVMDAESVAMLGDGSTDEGARRLDEMRVNLRRHKGKKLAKGKFSLAAKKPESYLPKMKQRGGVLRRAQGGVVNGGAMKRLNALADQFQRALGEGDIGAVEKLSTPLVALHPDSVKTGYEAFAKGGSVADAIRKLVSGLREKPKPQSRMINMMMTPPDRIPAGTDFNRSVDMDAVDAQLRQMKPDSPAVRLYESELRRKRAKSTAALYSEADQE